MIHYKSRKDFILRHLRSKSSSRLILDTGCVGEGANGFLHSEIKKDLQAGDTLIGIDQDKRVNDFAVSANIQYRNFSIFSEEIDEFKNKADVVVLAEVFEHLPTPYLALHKIFSLLKKDGILIMTYPNPLRFDNFCRYLWQKDVCRRSFVEKYAGAKDHKIFPMPPCLVKYFQDEFNCEILELSFLKGWLSRFPILNKFSNYIGLSIKNLGRRH